MSTITKGAKLRGEERRPSRLLALRLPAPPALDGSALSYLPAIGASVALGALSLLLLPRALTYDPWSWMVWGRELDHLALTTRGAGSSFKPLPVIVDAVITPLGRAAPIIWLGIVRSGLALSLIVAFHLARRAQGVFAGLAAVVAMLSIYQLLSYFAMVGMSEPLTIACCLAAVDCGLSRRHTAATVWLVAASLMELELVPAVAIYILCYGLCRRRPRSLIAAVAIPVVICAVWLLPDLITAGNALRSASRAAIPTEGGPVLSRVPALATIGQVHAMLVWPVIVGWVGELIAGAVALWRRNHLRPLFIPAVAAVLLVLAIAATTQLHATTGHYRFFIASGAIAAVAAACFWVELCTQLARELGTRGGAGRHRDTTVLRDGATSALRAALLVALALGMFLVNRHAVRTWEAIMRESVHDTRISAALERQLPTAIARAGGRTRILSCGRVQTAPLSVPGIAWAMDVRLKQVAIEPAASGGTIFLPSSGRSTISRIGKYREVARTFSADASWTVLSSCAGAG